MWLRDAVASNKLPTLKDLGNPRYFPYRFGHAFWAYVGGRWGDDKVVDLFRDGLRSGDPQMSIKKVLEQDEKTFSKEWGEAVHRAYAGFLEAQRDPQYYGPRDREQEARRRRAEPRAGALARRQADRASSPRGTCSRSTSSSPTPTPAR